MISVGAFVLATTSARRPAWAADGDGARLTLTGPGTPYESVVFEVAERRGAVAATVTKTFAGDAGRRERVGLLTAEDLQRLLTDLEASGAFTLKDVRRKGARARWKIEVALGTSRHACTVEDPELSEDGRYRRIIADVRTLVDRTAGEVPFRDARVPAAEAGTLKLDSVPRAHVYIDGIRQEGVTPYDALLVPEGVHQLRFDALDLPLSRTYEVRVEAGKTTSLRVDLK